MRFVACVSLGLLFAILLGACSSTPEQPSKNTFDVSKVGDAIPTKEAPSRTGNPRSYEVFGKRYTVSGTSEGYRQRGTASWYGDAFHGKRTSSGRPFNMFEVSAAHKHLPIPTYVKVTRLDNGRSIIVRVDDRGPFVDDRIIDLSYAAAAKLDMLDAGTAPVEVVALAPYQYLPGFPYDNPDELLSREASAPQTQPVAASYDATAPDLQPATTLRAAPESGYLPEPLLALEPRMAVASATLTQRPTGTPVTHTNALYLQVGAFGERRNAEALQNRLARNLGISILVDSREAHLHRVRVGPFSDAAELESIALQLADLGIYAPRIVFE